jgi:HK97 family phage major capsid protein
MNSKELRQRLGELTDASRKIIDRAHSEKRARSAEEEAELGRLDADLDQVERDIDVVEKQEAREARLAQPQTRAIRPGIGAPVGEDEAEEQRAAVEKTFRERFGRMGQHIARRMLGNAIATKAYRKAFDTWFVAPRGTGVSTLTPEEQRALSVGVAAEGGYTVPQEEFIAELIKEVDNQSVIRGISRTFQVPMAQSLGAPTLSADPSDPSWTTELSIGSEDSTMAFGKRELHPWPLAKYIKVSDKLLRASPLGMETIVRDRLAYKVATAESTAFNTGSGANEPLGIYTTSTDGIPVGRDVDISTSNAFDADKLIGARFTLRQGYWPNARWHFHRNILAAFRKLKTTDNYLWQPGLTVGAPNTLLDFPYSVDEYAPSDSTPTAARCAILGDFSNYWIVDALSVRVQRLDELFALTNQVGFVVRLEADAAPVLGDAFVACTATVT